MPGGVLFFAAHWSTSHFSRHLSSNPVMSGPLGRCSPVFEASQGIKAKVSKQPSSTRHLKHHQAGLEKWYGWLPGGLNFSWGRMKIQIMPMPMSAFFQRFRAKMSSDKVGDEMKTWSAHSYRPPYIFIQTLMMGVPGIKPCFHLCTPHTVLLLWPRRLLRLSSLHSERSAECHRSRHHPPAADFPVACVECGSFWSDLLTSHIHSTIIVNHISCPNPKYNSCDLPSSSDLWGQAIQQYSAVL